MRSSHWSVLLVLVGLVVGIAVVGAVLEHKAEAQGVPIREQPPRFQIFAWSLPGGRGVEQRGCYIVDTVTGELWHTLADAQPKKISEKLR